MAIPSFGALLSKNRVQFFILGIALLVFLGIVALLYYEDKAIFQRYIGSSNPVLLSIFMSIFGFLAVSLSLSRRWFFIYREGSLRPVSRYFILVLLFVSIAILVDMGIVYPADMNVLFPESLLFYPVMGFLVEILFHVVPLAVLLFLSTSIFKTISHKKLVWAAIPIVAVLEPTYQIFMDSYPVWAMSVVWVNLYLFNLVQLTVFRQYGFIFMYALRLVYYLFWHIFWGNLRLELLF